MRAGAAGLLIAGLAVEGASAQTASQITPPSFRPERTSRSGTLVFSGEPGLATPPGADKLTVQVSRVVVEDAAPRFAPEVQALQARLAGRRVPVAEIFAAARELEAAFVRSGAVLTRVVLPAQKLNDGGTLRLVVVKGFVDRVDYRNVPDNVRSRVAALLEPLVGQRDLQLGEIERRLLLAGDTPGVALRSTLSPSSTQGATTLIIESLYKPVTGFFSGDNSVGRPLGGFTLGGGFDANTLFGQGETIYFRGYGFPTGNNGPLGTGSPLGDNPRLRTLAGGFILPLGTDGMTFNVEYANSRTAPRLAGGLETSSDYDRLSFRLRYPWLRSRTANFFSEAAFDATRESLGLVLPERIAPLSLDRLRVLRLSSAGDMRFENGGVLAASGALSLGINGLGARSAADATPLLPLSRLGADAEFQKFDALISYVQPILDPVVLGLYARGQTSFGQALPRSEQIGFASFQELSTFDAGSLGGDSGWVVRSELSTPFNVTPQGIPLVITPYVFGATGALYLEQPTVAEKARLRVSAVGGGVRFLNQLEPNGTVTTLTLEFGRRFRDDALPDSNRFTVVGAVRF